MIDPLHPLGPVERPLIAPAPPAREVRRRRSDERPGERDRQRRDEPAAADDDDGGDADFPHVDVRA